MLILTSSPWKLFSSLQVRKFQKKFKEHKKLFLIILLGLRTDKDILYMYVQCGDL